MGSMRRLASPSPATSAAAKPRLIYALPATCKVAGRTQLAVLILSKGDLTSQHGRLETLV